MPGSVKGNLGYVLSHQADHNILPLIENAVEARTELAQGLSGNRCGFAHQRCCTLLPALRERSFCTEARRGVKEAAPAGQAEASTQCLLPSQQDRQPEGCAGLVPAACGCLQVICIECAGNNSARTSHCRQRCAQQPSREQAWEDGLQPCLMHPHRSTLCLAGPAAPQALSWPPYSKLICLQGPAVPGLGPRDSGALSNRAGPGTAQRGGLILGTSSLWLG